MKITTIMAFADELEKMAGHKAELAGLGILAAPALSRMAKGKSDWEDKAEVGGLGVLAYPSAKALLKKVK